MTDDELIERLFEVSGALYVQPELLAEWSRDWSPYGAKIEVWEEDLPLCAISPDSAEDVARVVQIANEADRPVMIRGGGSSLSGELFPVPGSILLDLAGLNVISEINEDTGLITVDAGVFGGELEAQLNSHGYSLALEPRSLNLATVGGMIATNAHGLFSTGYGDMAAKVAALEIVLTDGSLRQYSGEAACAPFCGGGMPGVITSATLRVEPHRDLQFVGFTFVTLPDALAFAHELVVSDARAAALAVYDEIERAARFERVAAGSSVVIAGIHGPTDQAIAFGATTGKALDSAIAEGWWAGRYATDWLVDGNEEEGWIADQIEGWVEWDQAGALIAALHADVDPLVSSLRARIEFGTNEAALLSVTFFIHQSSDERALDQYEQVCAAIARRMPPSRATAPSSLHSSTRFVTGRPSRRA